MSRRRSRFLRKPVDPFVVAGGASADDVLSRMERVSFQGRNLATAHRIWQKMLEDKHLHSGKKAMRRAVRPDE